MPAAAAAAAAVSAAAPATRAPVRAADCAVPLLLLSTWTSTDAKARPRVSTILKNEFEFDR